MAIFVSLRRSTFPGSAPAAFARLYTQKTHKIWADASLHIGVALHRKVGMDLVN
jgi:hypothetical protein